MEQIDRQKNREKDRQIEQIDIPGSGFSRVDTKRQKDDIQIDRQNRQKYRQIKIQIDRQNRQKCIIVYRQIELQIEKTDRKTDIPGSGFKRVDIKRQKDDIQIDRYKYRQIKQIERQIYLVRSLVGQIIRDRRLIFRQIDRIDINIDR